MYLNQLLIITLSVNGLRITKKDRDYQIWGDRQDPNISYLQRSHIKYKDTRSFYNDKWGQFIKKTLCF